MDSWTNVCCEWSLFFFKFLWLLELDNRLVWWLGGDTIWLVGLCLRRLSVFTRCVLGVHSLVWAYPCVNLLLSGWYCLRYDCWLLWERGFRLLWLPPDTSCCLWWSFLYDCGLLESFHRWIQAVRSVANLLQLIWWHSRCLLFRWLHTTSEMSTNPELLVIHLRHWVLMITH